MKISMRRLRQMISEVLRGTDGSPALVKCRVCKGRGNIHGEDCATCGGSGEELDYGSTRGGIGRGPLPWRV